MGGWVGAALSHSIYLLKGAIITMRSWNWFFTVRLGTALVCVLLLVVAVRQALSGGYAETAMLLGFIPILLYLGFYCLIRVPENYEWVMEASGVYANTLSTGTYVIPWGFKRVKSKIFAGEFRDPLFQKSEETELGDHSRVIFRANMVVQVENPRNLVYQVKERPELGQQDGQTEALFLARITIQGAIQSYARGLQDIDAALALRGMDVSAQLDPGLIADLSRWGLELVTVVIGDVEFPSETKQVRDKRYQEQQLLAVEQQRLEVRRQNVYNIARDRAGVSARKIRLSPTEEEKVADAMPEALRYNLDLEFAKALQDLQTLVTMPGLSIQPAQVQSILSQFSPKP